MDPFGFLLVALAGYRGARLVVDDDLPPVSRFREWVLARWPGDDRAEENRDENARREERLRAQPVGASARVLPEVPAWPGNLIECPWCTGFWTTLAAAAGWRWGGPVVRFGVVVFAAAGVQGLLSQAEKALSPDSWKAKT